MLEDLPSELDRGPLDPARIFAAVGLDDLIRLKRSAGRDRDLEDIATLLAARRVRVRAIKQTSPGRPGRAPPQRS